MIETARLKIYPASLERMETLIAAEDNEELRMIILMTGASHTGKTMAEYLFL